MNDEKSRIIHERQPCGCVHEVHQNGDRRVIEMHASECGQHYQCAQCRGIFQKGVSDEEAAAEAVEAFGAHHPSDAIVCDDCYQQVKP